MEVNYDFKYKMVQGLISGPVVLKAISEDAPEFPPVPMIIGMKPMSSLLPPTGKKDSEEVFCFKEFWMDQIPNPVRLSTIVTTPRHLMGVELFNLIGALPLAILGKRVVQRPLASVLVPSVQSPLTSVTASTVSTLSAQAPLTLVPTSAPCAPRASGMVSITPPITASVPVPRKPAPAPTASLPVPRKPAPAPTVSVVVPSRPAPPPTVSVSVPRKPAPPPSMSLLVTRKPGQLPTVSVLVPRKPAPLPTASVPVPSKIAPPPTASVPAPSRPAPLPPVYRLVPSMPPSLAPMPLLVQAAPQPVSVLGPNQLPSSFFIQYHHPISGGVWRSAPPMPVYIAPSISNGYTYEEGLRLASRPRPRLPPLFRHVSPGLTVPTVIHRTPIMQTFVRSDPINVSPSALLSGMCPYDGRGALPGFNPVIGNPGFSFISGNAGFNPAIANAGLNQVGGNPGFNVVNGTAGFNPVIPNAVYNQASGNAGLRPANGNVAHGSGSGTSTSNPMVKKSRILPANQNPNFIPTSGQQGRPPNSNLNAEGQPIIQNSINGGPVVILRGNTAALEGQKSEVRQPPK